MHVFLMQMLNQQRLFHSTCEIETDILIFNFFFQGYNIQIFDLNDIPADKLASAISLAYDKVNSRVTVTALFPEPICLRACINYQRQKLANGDFDIIVLSSKYVMVQIGNEFGGSPMIDLILFLPSN